MKVIIIDDEPLARQYVRECLKSHPECHVLSECGDGFEAFKAIQEHKPDLIFLDIQMPRMSGFELLELLEHAPPPAVIFTTAFDNYAIKAFEANATDYLLKPFDQQRFDRALSKVSKEDKAGELPKLKSGSPEEQVRIVLRHQGEIRILATRDVLYLEAWDDYVKIHTKEGVYVKKQTLSHYEESLNPKEFVRCHRSYLVNVSCIRSVDQHELRLINGFIFPSAGRAKGVCVIFWGFNFAINKLIVRM